MTTRQMAINNQTYYRENF